jgi:LacI family transcriptional regulator
MCQGDGMVTLKEVAEMCGVSATTVSNVINGKEKTSEETRQRILQVVEETGYKPNVIAKGLRSKRSRTIAIVAEDLAQFTSPPMIESMMESCEKMDYRVVVHNLRLYDRWQDTWYNRADEYYSVINPVLRDLVSAQVDGIIYVAGHARIVKTFNNNFELPVVMCYAYSESNDIPSVVIDDEESAYEMVKYLISNGHKRIGIVGGRIENIHTAQRLAGYQRAMFEHGLLFDPKLVFYGDWSRQSGYEGARKLMQQNVTALFGISDLMTGGIYDYLYENDIKIGKEISVAGFDNEGISDFFRPRLTTTELPLRDIGRKSAELLLHKLEAGDEEKEKSDTPEVYKIPCCMRVRESVKKI